MTKQGIQLQEKTEKRLLTVEKFIDKYGEKEFTKIVNSFDCLGEKRKNNVEVCKKLNKFLTDKSLSYARNNFSETYLFIQNHVGKCDFELIAYCAIQAGQQRVVKNFKTQIRHLDDELNDFFKKDKDIINVEFYPDIEIPYFAVNGDYQGQGYGVAFMFLIFKKVYKIAQDIGCPILVISEPADTAFEFYKSLSFIPCETSNPRSGNLAIPTKELLNLIE